MRAFLKLTVSRGVVKPPINLFRLAAEHKKNPPTATLLSDNGKDKRSQNEEISTKHLLYKMLSVECPMWIVHKCVSCYSTMNFNLVAASINGPSVAQHQTKSLSWMYKLSSNYISNLKNVLECKSNFVKEYKLLCVSLRLHMYGNIFGSARERRMKLIPLSKKERSMTDINFHNSIFIFSFPRSNWPTFTLYELLILHFEGIAQPNV